MRRIALVTLIAFGCATARPPATPPPVWLGTSRVGLAEPELELWMEGTQEIDPAESARSLDQSRDALAQALAGRGLLTREAPDEVLVVHARAIARTSERKTAQVMTWVGIVFVVVAVIVVAVLTSRSGSGRSAGSSSPSGAVRPAGTGPIRPGPWAPAYVPYRGPPPPPFAFGFGLNVNVSFPTMTEAPWSSPTHAWLSSRGWFDGDRVELVAEIVDVHTGEVRWSQTTRDSTDPRDVEGMTKLVDRLLTGLPFAAKQPPAPPLDDLREPPPPSSASPETAPGAPPSEPPPPPPAEVPPAPSGGPSATPSEPPAAQGVSGAPPVGEKP